jgi:hypothetical protein
MDVAARLVGARLEQVQTALAARMLRMNAERGIDRAGARGRAGE